MVSPTYKAPGCRLNKEMGSRPSIGMASICCVETESPRVASLVLRVCALAETSTVTVSVCTVRSKSMVAGWLTSNSALLDWLPKPCAVAVILYLAGGSCGNAYWPALLASAVRVWPLALFDRVILAAGTSAPLGSLMVPRSEVVAVWEKIGRDRERMQQSIHPHGDFFTSVPPKTSFVVRL